MQNKNPYDKKMPLRWCANFLKFSSITSINAAISGFIGKGVGRHILGPYLAEKTYYQAQAEILSTTQAIASEGLHETFFGNIIDSVMGYAPSSTLMIQSPLIAHKASMIMYKITEELIENHCTVGFAATGACLAGGLFIGYQYGRQKEKSSNGISEISSGHQNVINELKSKLNSDFSPV